MKKQIQWRKTLVYAFFIAVITFVITFSQILYSWDKLIADPLYQRPSSPDNTIKILAVDEQTIKEYGEFFDWSREIPARLVRLLNNNPDTAPAVIAFDVIYTSERDKNADAEFADACAKAGNVVTAVNLVYRTEVTRQEGTLIVDDDHISTVEYPYEALKKVSKYGFANTYMDKDQFVRYARL